MDSRCRQRSHLWDKGPKPGSVCTRPDCGKRFGEARGKIAVVHSTNAAPPERPRPAEMNGNAPAKPVGMPAPTGAPNSRDERFARLRERWGAGALAGAPANDNGQGAGAVVALDEPSLKVEKKNLSKLVDVVGPLAPQLLVGVAAGLVRWMGREPNKPDPEWLDKLRESTDEIIKSQLPEIEVGPWGALAIWSTAVTLSMYMGAEKLPDKKPAELVAPAPPPVTTTAAEPAKSAPTPATAAATFSPESLAVAPPMNDNTRAEDVGNAKSAHDGQAENGGETAFAGNAI